MRVDLRELFFYPAWSAQVISVQGMGKEKKGEGGRQKQMDYIKVGREKRWRRMDNVHVGRRQGTLSDRWHWTVTQLFSSLSINCT